MNGGYDLEGVIYHQHSNLLMKKILELWPDKNIPIVDLGCGHNFYVSVLRYAGYWALGYDIVDLGSKYFSQSDCTKPILLTADDRQVETNVISLEIGEHIPYDKCFGYLDNVTSFGGDVIMSWAVPGQAGHGHINCQTNHWVLEKMDNRGYRLDLELTNELRQAVQDCRCTWFKNTLMYFRPKSTFSMI
jgi:hypothetical protein